MLSQWADENLGMTALHPAGRNEEGKPRKDLWPLPEGSADPIPNDQDPLEWNLEVRFAQGRNCTVSQKLLMITMEPHALRCHVTTHV